MAGGRGEVRIVVASLANSAPQLIDTTRHPLVAGIVRPPTAGRSALGIGFDQQDVGGRRDRMGPFDVERDFLAQPELAAGMLLRRSGSAWRK